MIQILKEFLENGNSNIQYIFERFVLDLRFRTLKTAIWKDMDQRINDVMEICEGLPPGEHDAACAILDGAIGQLQALSLNSAPTPIEMARTFHRQGNVAELDATRGRINEYNISYMDLMSLQPGEALTDTAVNIGLSELEIPESFELYSSALAQHLLVAGGAERFALTRTRPTIMVLSVDFHFSVMVVTDTQVLHADSWSSSSHGQHVQSLAARMGREFRALRTAQQEPGSNDCGLHAMNVQRYVARHGLYRNVGSMAARRSTSVSL